MRHEIARPRPPLDAHNALALTLSEELGVAPEPTDWPELSEPLLFGPMLPPRYRLAGPGATPDARALFTRQLAASPRAPVDPADVGRPAPLRHASARDDGERRYDTPAPVSSLCAGVRRRRVGSVRPSMTASGSLYVSRAVATAIAAIRLETST